MDKSQFISCAQQLRRKAQAASLRYGALAEEAEDIAQDTMVRLWQLCSSIDNQKKAEALATVIARNITIDRVRRQRRISALEETVMESPDSSLCPERILEEQDDAEWLQRKLKGLPTTEYTILHLRQYEELSLSEIASLLGLEESSVSSLLSRARHQLLREIQKRMRR